MIGFAFVGTAVAQGLTISQYRHPETGKELSSNKAYLSGVAEGLTAYNIAAIRAPASMRWRTPQIGPQERLAHPAGHWDTMESTFDRAGADALRHPNQAP